MQYLFVKVQRQKIRKKAIKKFLVLKVNKKH